MSSVAVEVLTAVGQVLYYALEALFFAILPTRFRQLKSFEGEIALVTGAGSGLGRLLSLRLAKLGAKVVLWDLNADSIKVTRQMIEKEGGQAFDYRCDVTDRQLVYRTADTVRAEVGDVSILINNAGIVSGKNLLDIPDEKVILTMNVNATSHFWTIKSFLPAMLKAKHGHIVTISSMAGKVGCARLTDYCASKFAAVGLHTSLAEELRESGVDLTNVCPYFINTGMFEGVKSKFPLIIDGLDQHDVTDRIVRAIQLNEPEVILPPIFHFLLFLGALLPYKAYNALSDLFEHREIMSTFTGREGAPSTGTAKESRKRE